MADVASVASPRRPGRSLLGHLTGSLQARARARGRRPSKIAALVQDHVLTVFALGSVDTGLFHLGPVAGWIGLGVSLLVLDLKLQG